jgi:predicted dehydrogenase
MIVWNGNDAETVILPPDEQTATSCVEHFCRALRGEEDLIPTAEQGLQGLKLVEAIYRSAEIGKAVEMNGEQPAAQV